VSESTEQANETLAVADSIDRLTDQLSSAIYAMKPPELTAESPLRCTVADVSSASGWRALVGELVDGQIVYSQLPLMSWITKVVHAVSCDDVVLTPLVWDRDRQQGVELSVYLEMQRCTSPGICSRILAPGQESLSAPEVSDFEREIRETFRIESRGRIAAVGHTATPETPEFAERIQR
jgi:hypothetical protein